MAQKSDEVRGDIDALVAVVIRLVCYLVVPIVLDDVFLGTSQYVLD